MVTGLFRLEINGDLQILLRRNAPALGQQSGLDQTTTALLEAEAQP